MNAVRDRIEYSVVIPVYNSSDSLPELVAQLTQVFEEEVRATYEIIMIDDASPSPDTWPALERLAKQYPSLVIVQLMRNFGKTGAVLCGFEAARGDYVFTMDDDLQHHPSDIPKFIEKKSHDVVMGVYAQRHHPWFKRLTSRIKAWFDHILIGKPKHLTINPFRLYRADITRSMLAIQTPYPFIPALMFYVTHDIVTVTIQHSDRKYGQSNYTTLKRLQTFSNLLINNSSLLLRTTALLGIIVAALSFGITIYFFVKNLIHNIPVPGWTSLFVAMLGTNGLILFAIGVMGEYLVRIAIGIEKRPPYIARRTYSEHR